jgi:hypothetical protein
MLKKYLLQRARLVRHPEALYSILLYRGKVTASLLKSEDFSSKHYISFNVLTINSYD